MHDEYMNEYRIVQTDKHLSWMHSRCSQLDNINELFNKSVAQKYISFLLHTIIDEYVSCKRTVNVN